MAGKFNFLKLQNITLRNFSLYKKNGEIYEVNEEINKGVYCLAGANGLGKTTFLNSLNYGLTGIVLDSGKEVFSPAEIITANKKHTDRYFLGRINTKDQEKAEIEILFKVNEIYFRIVRGFFEREELRLFEVFTLINNRKTFLFKRKNESSKTLNLQYQKILAQEIGFANFDYFAFYQLYIFSFDENRRMIFWDDRASALALAIAFNSDPKDADKILDMTRRMEKHESNARNLKWQSTQAKKKIEEFTPKSKKKKIIDLDKLEQEYNKLNTDVDKTEKTLGNIKIEYDTMLKKQSHLNSDIMQLRIEHMRLFSRYSRPRSVLLKNVNIQLSIKNHECCLCGSGGESIVESIERSTHKDKCPLCNTTINESNNKEQNDLLKQIQKNDSKIASKNSELETLIFEIDGKKLELSKTEVELKIAREKLSDFTEDNPDLAFTGTGDTNIDSLIDQYRKQASLSEQEAKEQYAKRDKLKKIYEKLLRKVETSYKEAETIFVPTFKKLAKSFIGLDLNIKLQRTSKTIETIKLVLELQDTARTEFYQLSESQRFFLDIAMRMSLAIYLSNKNAEATMLIDTPEGSLDIAYESRVGNMFAQYVTEYNQNLLITANINASELLVSLAKNCGKSRMKFRRMLDWTDLSEVQKEGEKLFKSVFLKIENALKSKK